MYRIKLTLVVFTMACAALAAISSAALASPQWYINGSAFTGTETIEATSLSSMVLTGTVLSQPLEILCDFAKSTGTITENSKGTISPGLAFSDCKFLVAPTGCKIAEKQTASAWSFELVEEGGKVFGKFTPKSGASYLTLEITECALEGTYTVKGELRCEVPNTGSEGSWKECFFTASSSSLKLGANAATLTQKVLLTLSGTNVGKQFGLSSEKVEEIKESTISYGVVSVGEGKSKTFKLKVSGTEQKFISSAAMPDPLFKVTADTCSEKTISVGGECEVTAEYTPRQAEEKSKGFLEVRAEEAASPHKVIVYDVPLEGEA